MSDPTATAALTTTETIEPTITILSFPVASADSGHVMCCANEDVSLCGQDISMLPVVQDRPSGCRVCDHLEPSDFCPLGLTCEDHEDVH